MAEIIVSVIIPLYNEERYIASLLESLEKQTYPRENMEWILVDGMSGDGTVAVIRSAMETGLYPIVLLKNEKKKTPVCAESGDRGGKGEVYHPA